MNAKCPECAAADSPEACDECDGSGTIQVSFATGDMFTRHCLDPACGLDNGGRICEGFPAGSSGPCPACGGKTEWVFLGRKDGVN